MSAPSVRGELRAHLYQATYDVQRALQLVTVDTMGPYPVLQLRHKVY